MRRSDICLKEVLITPTIKKAYFLYFGCKVGDQVKKCAPHVLHVYPNSKRGWIEKDVCRLECPWFGGCLAITVLTYFCVVPPTENCISMKKKINTCVSEYTISNSACASCRWTSCSRTSRQFCYVLWWQRHVSSNSKEQQSSVSRDTDYLPSIDSSIHKITEGELNDLH